MYRSERNAERPRCARRRNYRRTQTGSIVGIFGFVFAGFLSPILDESLASLWPGYHLLVTPAFARSHRDRGGSGDSGHQGDQGQDFGHENSDSHPHGDGNNGNFGGNSNTDSRGDSDSHRDSDGAQSAGPQAYPNGASFGDDGRR